MGGASGNRNAIHIFTFVSISKTHFCTDSTSIHIQILLFAMAGNVANVLSLLGTRLTGTPDLPDT